jgi:exodeoxyribonuclease VII large subunit
MTEPAVAFVPRPPWSVAALIGAVGDVVDAGFPSCTVRGEITGFSRAASGHCYFSLKDPDGSASIRCAMFRRAAQLASFTPREGDSVDLRGRLAVYAPRGELQFVVEAMIRGGAGALYERFLRLKAQLDAEGLFDASLKRDLPAYPEAVGVVTSLSGAALHDVATTLARRSPHVRVIVYPSLVQGVDAPAALCRAVSVAAERREVDVLVVCRGGGSLEDLWAFNEESVVRAIRAAPMPVLSGVGHETDVTLADLAADLRAPTPTAAAELVAPATAPALETLDLAERSLVRRMHAALEREEQRLDRISLRLARPGEGVARRTHGLDLIAQRLAGSVQRALAARRGLDEAVSARLASLVQRGLARQAARIDGASGRLEALDPRRVLLRGYALLSDAGGRAVTSVDSLRPGASLTATLHDGAASVEVRSVRPSLPGL